MTHHHFALTSAIWFILLVNSHAEGYDLDAHQVLGRLSGQASSIDSILREELAFSDGARTPFRRGLQLQVPEEWIADGARTEDIPDLRVLNHFHNPLADWGQAGLTVFGVQLGQSSVLWQQNPNQNDARVTLPIPGVLPQFQVGGGNWSWQDARRFFLDGLTKESTVDREGRFADTFLVLGHLTHLVQDATVPAHVRNDQHLKNGSIDFSDGYENFVNNNVARIPEFAAGLVKPASLGFTVTGRAAAPVAVARLIDTDLFTGLNADMLAGTSIGIAEYTNGNFLTQDTLFKDFTLPRERSLRPQQLVPEGGGQRQYFRKVEDGEPVDFFVAKGTLFDRLLFRGSLTAGYLLTDKSYASYAAKLLPRAVGYSAALIDYFFRSKLDIDLFPDPNDPSLVQLKGTNAASDPNAVADPLVKGDLTLYWDGGGGVRRPVLAVDPTTLSADVAGGGPITSARFQPPADAERFVAVYQGTLGNEVKDPARNFPGGVIGKVLGGFRVEQLFPDGTRWNLRTPKGIFPLPILQADVIDLRWGDLDNTLVGRSKFTSGTFGFEPGPNRMFAYRIKRPLGSVDVPLVNGMVDVEQVANVPFPLGLDIGGVQLNAGISYRQYLASAFVSEVVGDPTLTRVTGVTAEVAATATASTTLAWRLTLDEDKLDNFRGVRPHIWELKQIGVRADGHIVALVLVTLNPQQEFALFPSRIYVTCGAPSCPTPPTVEDGPLVPVAYSLGRVARAVWALVDVTAGRLLFSTAPPTLTINNVIEVTTSNFGGSVGSSGFISFNAIREKVDRDNGTVSYAITSTSGLACTPPQASIDVEIRSGVLSATQVHLRPELAAADFPPMVPPRTVSVIVGCIGGFQVRTTRDSGVPVLPYVQEAFRAADGSDRVVVLVERQTVPGAPTFGNPQTRVIAWDASQTPATARLALAFPDAEVGSRQILSVSRDLGLVRNPFPPLTAATMTVIPLEGTAPARTFPISSVESRNFRVLSPAFLYHVSNLKFHRSRDLARTALPATLATGGNTLGDHHAMRLP